MAPGLATNPCATCSRRRGASRASTSTVKSAARAAGIADVASQASVRTSRRRVIRDLRVGASTERGAAYTAAPRVGDGLVHEAPNPVSLGHLSVDPGPIAFYY